MLIWLLDLFSVVAAGALSKITLRAALAAVISFTLAVLFGSRWIAWLKSRYCEPIVSDSPTVERLHRHKSRTPTMGGLFIIAGILTAIAVLGRLDNALLQMGILVAVGLAMLGAVDDLTKLRGGRNGMSARKKILGQTTIATVIALLAWRLHSDVPGGLDLAIPLTDLRLSLGLWYVPLAVLVIVGSSNAVNLTDGLDGLAGGCLIFTTCAMGVLVYACGHAELAYYLNLPHIPECGELTVLAGAMIGGLLGFLWFNCHPAQVFMGDTGSLPLGGLLGLLAVASRQEFALVLVAGVFVAEAGSVILQVGFYKWKKRRIFRCAPLHHHFQFLGWPENKIVVRFWIASALLAVLGVASVKLTLRDDRAESDSKLRAGVHTELDR